MIRRIAKTNDLKDLIKSCPSGVIDDITEIRYFISGHPETEIVATFEKVGSHLEAILPTSDLATLSNGVLMRRALYKVEDSSYPDGYYNLEFVDNLDVWLGDEETEDPFDPGYLTEGDLKTLNGESLVGVGNIDVVNYIPDYYATKSWVSEQGYIVIEEVEQYLSAYAYATEDWVRGQEYLSSIPSEYVTQSWLSSNYYMTESDVNDFLVSQSYVTEELLSSHQFATQSWVQSQGYITSAGLSGLATQSWVLSQGYITSETLPEDIATQSWVEGYISECGFAGLADVDALSRWIVSQNYATQSWVSSQQFATQSWVSLQGYLTSVPSEYATKSWVSSQNFLTSTSLTGYATESWVEAQGYLTSHQDLSSYATKSWVSTNYLEESKVWCGTQEQWNRLTSEEKASYKIALVTL